MKLRSGTEIEMDNETVEELKDLIKGMQKKMDESFKSLETNKTDNLIDELKQVKEKNQKLARENIELQRNVEDLKFVTNKLKIEVNAQKEKLVKFEAHSRRDNLIFFGIRQDKQENCETKIRNVLQVTMQVPEVDQIKFDRCHRLGGPMPRPIICKFNWYKDKERVFNNRSKLANSGVSVSEDFPAEMIDRRKTLYPFMQSARKIGKFSELQGDRLYIDGKTYTVNTLDRLPPGIDPANSAVNQYGNVIAFFGGQSPLSNFFKCDINIQESSYSSVEQYFQYQKCILAENMDAARRVREAKSPAVCKRIGDSIHVDVDEWQARAPEVMREGMRAKFTQNARAKAFLLKTGDCILAEACKDLTWGTGLKLDNKANAQKENWLGKNVTGHVLMTVRQELSLLV
jgi:ribA/ribD-fused uncharacterized protein